ncbi:AraC family transcriptional regulator [Alteromonas sp. ZYF713]|nr:AraC family transcriptional regulator [Alteromonas sp. ZYF713]
MHKAHYHKSNIEGIEVVEICSDRTFPRHTHDEFGLGYIISGGQESWSGRGLVEASVNNIITVNSGEVHDGIGISGKPRHWKMLFIKPEKLASLTERSASSLEFCDPVIHRSTSNTLLKSALEMITQPGVSHDELEQRLMLAFSMLLDDESPDDTVSPDKKSKTVNLLLELIQDNWNVPLSLEDMAHTVNLSRYQTLRHFQKQMNMTPHTWLTQYRVKQAKKRLQQGHSLVNTAVECGFADQSHMTRAFKRQFGLSPGKLSRFHAKI